MAHTVISLQTTKLSEFASLVQTEEPSAATAADKYSKEVLMMLLMDEIEVLPPLI